MTMTADRDATRPAGAGLPALIARGNALFAAFPASLPQLALRIAVAIPFLKSGFLKWDGFLQLSETAVFLFAYEFKLHILGSAYSFPAPGLTAYLAGLGEIILPFLLIFGLGTRFAALGLIVMTGVIQLTVPTGWAQHHLPWAAMLFATLVWGPGKISLDHLISLAFRRR